MIDNPVLFYTAAALILGFAVWALCLKNIIYSLLAAVAVFFTGAAIFCFLGSEYNAIIQAAVYGLAIPVVTGVSIMFCNPAEREKREHPKSGVITCIVLFCAGIFILGFTHIVLIPLTEAAEISLGIIRTNSFDNLAGFAYGIFTDYLWAFELVSLLLTIVIAGIAMLAGRKNV